MLKRVLMLTAVSTGTLFALTACGGGDEPDPVETAPHPVGDDDDDSSSDTYTSDGYLAVKTIFVGGFMTWSEDASTTVTGKLDGQDWASANYIMLGTSTHTGDWNNSSEYCVLWTDTTGATNEQWATDDGYLFGFLAPQDGAAITDDCIDKGFDPDWFEGDPQSFPSTYPIGAAIGGDPTTEVLEWMDNVGVDTDDYDFYIGGRLNGDSLELPDADVSCYWRGYEVDVDFNISEDGIDRFSISDGGGGLAEGYYEWSSIYFWTFATD